MVTLEDLICISLKQNDFEYAKMMLSNDVENLFMCLFDIPISLIKCLFKSHFNSVFCFFFILGCESSLLYLLKIFYQIYVLQIFSPNLFLFIFVTFYITEEKFFFLNFDKAQFINISFCSFWFLSPALKNFISPHAKRLYSTLPSGNFIILSCTYTSIIHFEIIFLYGVRYLSLFIVLHMDV